MHSHVKSPTLQFEYDELRSEQNDSVMRRHAAIITRRQARTFRQRGWCYVDGLVKDSAGNVSPGKIRYPKQ